MVFDFHKKVNYTGSNKVCKKIFEEIPDLIFQFIVTPDNFYVFPIVSSSITEIFEITFEDLENRSEKAIFDRILDIDKTAFFESYISARKNLKRWELEFRVCLPKKGERWLKIASKSEVEPDGSVTFYGRISDITDMKDQELKLKISEARYQFALEASTEGVWDWDMRTNNVFYSSQSMKILDLESMDIFDSPERWDEIVHPDDLAKYYSDIHEHFDNKIPFYENYHRVMTSSGKYKWILDRGKVIERDENGKPLRVIGTHTDISAQKEKELELVKTMQLFREQNSRLLNFSHIVSHNLNTHAGNIKSILDFIDDENDADEKQIMMSHLRTVSNDLNNTIVNLTEIVAIQNDLDVYKVPLNLDFYINCTADVVNLNDKKITIVNEVPDTVSVNFNPAYLESVLLNFTTNAIKYSHPDRFPIVKFTFTIENNLPVLSITDNGLGLDLERYGEQLFGMYKTFHNHEDAQGIGLYITKNQIEAMKGSVAVESELGVGTTFKIIFNTEI